MARRNKNAVLPGLSRSSACTKTKSCGRLDGHKGRHRSSLTTTKVVTQAPASTATKSLVEKGVEVHSADRYEVQPEAVKAPARPRARRPKVVVIPMADYRRIVAAGVKVTKSRGYIVSSKPSARLA